MSYLLIYEEGSCTKIPTVTISIIMFSSVSNYRYRNSKTLFIPVLLYLWLLLYVDEVSCGQKRSFQSVPKGSQEVDLLNRRGAP